MWSRALLLVLLTALSADGDDNQDYESELKVGRSINIFPRYGYLSISMKVVPRNDSDYVFREPTVDFFTGLEQLALRPKRFNRKSVFQGEFHMEFCDNLDQLLQAYFRNFSFEKLVKPWKAFTASWSPEIIARNLGINSSFVHGDYCYVLVRLSRFRDNVSLSRLPNNVRLDETVAEEIDNIKVGDAHSVLMFIQKFGTHYIDSFITGNAMYQVFVYKRSVYQQVKQRLQTRGISHLTGDELTNYFSPWYAEHMGLIKVASGNKTLESWAATRLRKRYYLFTFPSLLKIHGDSQLLRLLNEFLTNEAILEMDMKTVLPAFKDPLKKKWFEEVLDNFLRLWESNM